MIERIKYYYYITNKLTEFKKDIKSIRQIFGEKATAVLAYIQDNKLDIKKEDDLINIFNFYSTL
ncbi:hypothetical protein DU508_05580 [Pedobacter chinensis]|uniref:Uncharacterized protein n=1 Tax=Pedobacter chinensis TaxID=2282421 RepID=A0A369PWR5_9SPHI|nr:hypothetical protein DU508_05580 [Pedobacter chinensis]